MIKSLLPEVSKEVGKSGAFILNQLALLFKSFGNKTNKIYRTDKELFNDLEGLISQSTIKRNKKVLVEHGYIQVSFDKGHKRQTYYSLTEKALLVLEGFISNIREYISPIENKKTVSKEAVSKKENNTVNTVEHANATTKGMKESFNEGFNNNKAIPMPETVKETICGVEKEVSSKVSSPVEHEIRVSNFNDLIKTKKSNVKPSEESLSFKEKLMNIKNDVVDTVKIVNETCNMFAVSEKEDTFFDVGEELLELRKYNNDEYGLMFGY